jgi:NAD(P)-dependent dehydrogenase (short-subunit alcohol dehydrogenase family)
MLREIVVTGAGRGMGYHFAKQHLEMGDRVFALTRTVTNELKQLDNGGGKLVILQCDIASLGSVQAAAAKILSLADHVDILYNNAGVNAPQDDINVLDAEDIEYFLNVYNINAVGPLRMVRALKTLLKKGSVILNVSSECGSIYEIQLASHKNICGYAMSKAALNMGMRMLANILEGTGVHVFLLEPGWVRTEMAESGIKKAPEAVRLDFEARSVKPEVTVANMIDIALHPKKVPEGHIYVSHQMKLMQW